MKKFFKAIGVVILTIIGIIIILGVFGVLDSDDQSAKNYEAYYAIKVINETFDSTEFDNEMAFLDSAILQLSDTTALYDTISKILHRKEDLRSMALFRYEIEKINWRNEKINEQFSAWDGSHTMTKQYVKDNMNDPGSFEHVETVYWDKTDYLIVQMKFRGRNSFGGLVLNTITTKCNPYTGDLYEIVSYE